MAGASNFKFWTKEKRLGEGTFGEVWEVNADNGMKMAAKYIKKEYEEGVTMNRDELRKEVDILKQLSHPNVVKFITAKEDGMVIFTEFIDGENLESRDRLSEPIVKGYLKQICSGLNYLHTRSPPVLHRDIKGGNIMVTRDGTVKLIDFGISVKLMVASGVNVSQAIRNSKYGCGTVPFMAPELFNMPSQFSVKSDVWAVGITIYQMMAGQHTFEEHCKMPNLFNFILTSGAPQLPAGSSQQLADFYACCTAMNPAARKSVRQLMEHGLIA